MFVPLSRKAADMPLQEQLALLERATERRRAYPFPGPFQKVVAFEFRPTERLTIYLNPEARFEGGGEDVDQTRMNRRPKEEAKQPVERYLVGVRKEDFSWFLAEIQGGVADDQNLLAARQFCSLSEAISVSTAHQANVFEFFGEGQNVSAREILVDLNKVGKVPFDGGYWLLDKLAVGPNPICFYACDTEQRLRRLRRAGVRVLISLLEEEELLWSEESLNKPWFAEFEHHVFPLQNGGVPTRKMMKLILDVIDESIRSDHTTYVHSFRGQGRSGLVAACFAARHGVGSGQRVLNFLAERRFEYALFDPSPESHRQREYVRGWKIGE